MRWPAFLLFLRALAACTTGDEPVLTTIPVVQGSGPKSPCEGRVVTMTGVVTGAFPHLSGYFLQDPSGDGDPATSDGIFVFQGSSAALPARGSLLRVTGKVAEFARAGRDGSVTELDVRASASPLVKVEALGASSLPGAVALDPPLDGDGYLEAREGMLVAYPESVVVEPSNDFGEYHALRVDRLPARVRPRYDDPGTGRPVLIDRSFRQTVKTYDLAPRLTGVLHFDFGEFRLEPVSAYSVDDAGLRPTAAPARGVGEFAVASLNAQRLVRGDLPGAALGRKLDRLAAGIRGQLRSPELVAIEEVEDLELLAELGARAGGYQAVLLKGCDFSGINVGLLYNPDRVRVLTTTQLQAEAPQFRKGPCTLPDGRRFSQILFDRPPLRADLALDGIPVTVLVNHWRSQIGGRGEQRQASAEFLVEELRRAAIPNLIVLGDFNDSEDSEPVRTLAERAGLTNTTWLAPLDVRYSLLFEGISQALDHILLSPSLAGRLIDSGYAHYNADFPPERAADHDNPWVRLRK
ncbi:MAG: hypothetical protein HYR60_33550 [Acidobacteria bacterium]|nr:hypothetical protein [Acidobacteriota bacterium]